MCVVTLNRKVLVEKKIGKQTHVAILFFFSAIIPQSNIRKSENKSGSFLYPCAVDINSCTAGFYLRVSPALWRQWY